MEARQISASLWGSTTPGLSPRPEEWRRWPGDRLHGRALCRDQRRTPNLETERGISGDHPASQDSHVRTQISLSCGVPYLGDRNLRSSRLDLRSLRTDYSVRTSQASGRLAIDVRLYDKEDLDENSGLNLFAVAHSRLDR
jgi:hypothetical protein